jgi:hypothetical protein
MLILLHTNHRIWLIILFKNLFILIKHLVSEMTLISFRNFVFYLVPDECLNELEGVRHFERAFQDRHPNVHRWPVWFKSSLDNAINQSVNILSLNLFIYRH